MNIIAIIQARTGSTRLPNKVLKILYDKTLIEHIIERVEYSKLITDIVVATTTLEEDIELVRLLKSKNKNVTTGSSENVLDRFYNTAIYYHADIIVRITADDPFKDPEIIDNAIKLLIENNYDYVSNTIKPTFPEGLDIEVFKFKALKIAYENAQLNSDKEHVTPYIWKNNNSFKIFNFEYTKDLSQMRWTIDYEEDYKFAQKIYQELYNKNKIFLFRDILNLINKKNIINQANHIRNEGYFKSIKDDNDE